MPLFIPTRTPPDIDDFTRGYFEAVEWLLDDETDWGSASFAPETIADASEDCRAFVESNAADLARYCELTGRGMDGAGVDFWLTRNGHGAGFWDRGEDPVFRRLSDASKVWGGRDAYLGDDGRIYVA
jgi:hypothetical protein